jgi:biopolymer transport protein ExbD
MPVKFKRDQSMLAMSMTPLIDVVFQLLLFFIFATRFADENLELEVPLPDASEARPITYVPQEIFININQEGQYFVRGRTVNEAELEDILLQAVANNPTNQSVRIHADRHAEFQAVVTAVNLCKRVGIRDYTADIAAENAS